MRHPHEADDPLDLPLPEVRDGGIAVLRALVLCDLVDSTALLEELGDQAAAELMRRHDRLSRAILQRCGGQEIDKTDGFLILFERPVQAVAFALNYHRALSEFEAVENMRLRARVGIHVGEVLLWDNTREDIARGAKPVDVEGLAKPMAARLMALAGPGQTLMSGLAYALAERSRAELGARAGGVRWQLHGAYRFKGIVDPVNVWEVGEPRVAPFRAPPSSEKARRLVPWWRRGASVALAASLVVAAFGVPLYLSMRAESAIAFAPRDWVVIGDLRNLTSDPALQEPLETAFRVSLEQSRFVNVVSDLKVRQSLARMDRPRDTPVDREVGAEIAVREGARALVLPTVTEVGGRVRVSAEVVDPNTLTTVYAESADGRGAESALASMDEVSRELRGRLGEALGAIEGDSQPLAAATTGSIDALRAYSLGLRAQARGRFSDARSLYEKAAKIDPEFALAHAGVARIYLSSGDRSSAKPHLDAAQRLRARLPLREAMQVDALAATYGDVDDMLEAWRGITEMYPDQYTAYQNYATFAYTEKNAIRDATEMAQKALSNFNPYLGSTHYLLAALALAREDLEAAARHLSSAEELESSYLGLVQVALHATKRDFQAARATLDAVEPSGIATNDFAIYIDRAALGVDMGDVDATESAILAARASARGISTTYALYGETLAQSTDEALGRAFAPTDHDRYIVTSRGLLDSADTEERFAAHFAIAYAAWRAATHGDVIRARAALASLPQSPGVAGHPVLVELTAAARGALAITEDRPKDALALLARHAGGAESLILTRGTIAMAHVAAGDIDAGIAAWGAIHERRGRAWSESVGHATLRPTNVALTNVAPLEQALLHAERGATDTARTLLAQFLARHDERTLTPRLSERVATLRAELDAPDRDAVKP
ncbi:MAG: putative peptide modification system cyclase [Xanthomonadaceae bacterium]|nr:putative peptide modification system cyclase [Xanthomonadaceae bacterium]